MAEGKLKEMDSKPSAAAQTVMREFVKEVTSKGVDALVEEYNSLKVKPSDKNHATYDNNKDRNRYRDVICIEESRVRLNWPPDNDNDYIHANWVKELGGMDKVMIATQAPLPNTVVDFWRMVWQEKCIAVLMLCCVVEKGRAKCEQYWPLNQNDTMSVCGLTIKNDGIEQIPNDVVYTRLILTGLDGDGVERIQLVKHVLWSGWPDKGVPKSTTGALRLIIRTQTMSPAVVHCSAGVGRTGTIVALDACLRMLIAGQPLSVYKIVKDLRNCRYLACQTDLQYLYIHRAIMAYIESKKVCAPAETDPFIIAYETATKKGPNVDVQQSKEPISKPNAASNTRSP